MTIMKHRIISALLAMILLSGIGTAAQAAEIEAVHTGYSDEIAVVAAEYAKVGSELEPEETLPGSYSSLDLGYVTPVRSQQYNTCWAYSSTASLETLMIKNGKIPAHLSALHMNFWGCTRPDNTGWQRSYTASGYPYIALGYLTSFGAMTSAHFSERMTAEDYKSRKDTDYPYVRADSVIYLDASNRDTIKTAVYEYGAAVGNLHYDGSRVNGAAYYCDVPGLATSQLNGHAVEIVGWDDAYSRENFHADHRPASDGAWLCKNSWGVTYGNSGYFWISYEDNYLFDSRFGPSYVITGYSDMTAIHRMKQNEIYGATYEFNYIKKNKPLMNRMTYANVLDFSDGYHNIDKVTFESTAEGAEYFVFYIPVDENAEPDQNSENWTLLAQGVIEHQGYICANTGGFAAPIGKGAVGVQIKANAKGQMGIGVDEWLTSGGSYLFRPDSQKGQSYLLGYDSTPLDVMDFYNDVYSDTVGGTFVIKALCSSDEILGDIDSDNEFSIIDVTLIQRMHAEIITFDDRQMRQADFDNDGEVDIIDVTRMQRRLNEIP